VERFARLAAVIRGADLADKAGICRGLNLVLAYEPATQTVHAQAHLNDSNQGYCSCPRSESNQLPILPFYLLSSLLAAPSRPDVPGRMVLDPFCGTGTTVAAPAPPALLRTGGVGHVLADGAVVPRRRGCVHRAL
jgi:hypothetical protein